MLEQSLKKFLAPFHQETLVLALSGGPDSMALFWGCLAANQPFVIAHVDHGWRAESQAESIYLKDLADKHHIKFYLKRCQKEDFKGNLEQAARLIRLSFFKEVVEINQANGVLMAHHADDLSETTLKKLLEGSSLSQLSSMKPIGEWQGLKILRPFLSLTKKEIVHYLDQRHYFVDASNFTSEFLRGRLRKDLFPLLKEVIGKEVQQNLVTLSQESEELQDYLSEQMHAVESIQGPFGECLFFEKDYHLFLIKAIVRKKSKEHLISISKEDVNAISDALVNKKANFQKLFKEMRIIADRGRLFFINLKKPLLSEWRWEYTEKERDLTDWKSLFQGCAIGWVPDGKWQITYGTNYFDKWWTSNKVPAFLREYSPIIQEEKGPVFEFLTARVKNKQNIGRKIALQYCACKRSLLE